MWLCQNPVDGQNIHVNITPAINAQNVKPWAKIDIGNTIEYDVKSYQVKDDYSKMYKSTHLRIEV